MTVRKRFQVRRGDKVSIGLLVESDVEQARANQKGDEGSKLLNPGDEENELYVFRTGIPIYNLGLRLIDAPHKMYAEIPMFQVLNRADRNNYDTGSLDDFFLATVAPLLDHAFQSTQSVPNRKPISKNVEKRYTDLIFTDQSDAEVRSILGKADRQFSNQFNQVSEPTGTNQLWKHNKVSVEIRKGKGIRIESVGYFYNFNTLDTTHFKVTDDPVFTADEVPALLNALSGIYLVPMIVPYTYDYNFRINTAPETTSTTLMFGPLMRIPFSNGANNLDGGGNGNAIDPAFVLNDEIVVLGNSNDNEDYSTLPIGEVVIKVINQQTTVVTTASITGGVPITTGSNFWEFPLTSDLVDIIPGLTVGIVKMFNPGSPFADGMGMVKTWVNSGVHTQPMAAMHSYVGYGGGGSVGPGFPILYTSDALVLDTLPKDDSPDIIYHDDPATYTGLVNRFMAEGGSSIPANETIIFNDVEANQYLSYPRPFSRGSNRDNGNFAVGSFWHPRTGMLVAALKSGNRIQYVWIKEPLDDQEIGQLFHFPQAHDSIVTGRIEDGSQFV